MLSYIIVIQNEENRYNRIYLVYVLKGYFFLKKQNKKASV